jgi:hypothetical protein
MPLENLEEEGLEKNPNLELALWKFLLSLPDHSGDKKLQSKLMEAVVGDSKSYIKKDEVYVHVYILHTHTQIVYYTDEILECRVIHQFLVLLSLSHIEPSLDQTSTAHDFKQGIAFCT